MASSRRTGTNESISTYDSGDGTKDYTAVITWENATDNDNVTDTVSPVLECYKRAHNDSIFMNGATNNATYFRIIRPADGEGHSGVPKSDGSCVQFNHTSVNELANISETFTHIQDLVGTLNPNTTINNMVFRASEADAAFVGTIAFDSDNAGTGKVYGHYSVAPASSAAYFINCLSHNMGNGGSNVGHQGFANAVGDTYMYNCTSSGNYRGFWTGGGTAVAKNCIADNNVDASFDGTWTQTTNISTTPTYLDSANDDFHLASSDTTAQDQGTDLSGDGAYAFDDDIDFETRSGTWDVGFDEYVVAAATYERAVTDGLLFEDTSSKNILGYPSTTDGVVFGDTNVNITELLSNVLDGVVFGDSSINVATLFSVLVDGIIFGENSTNISIFLSALVDGVVFGDSSIQITTKESSVTDGMVFGDTTSSIAVLLSDLADGMTFGDTADIGGIYNVVLTDGVVFGDSIVSVLAGGIYERSLTDGVKFGDSINNIAVLISATVDGITFGDVTNTGVVFEVSLTDGVDFGDLVSALAIREGGITDGVKFGDTVSSLANIIETVTDGVAFGDIVGSGGSIFNLEVSDGITLGDLMSAGGAAITGMTVTLTAKGAALEFTMKSTEATFTKKT